MIEWLGGVPAANYRAGRDGNPITGLVDHWIGEGTLDSAVQYFRAPRPAAPTSVHYVVGRDGRIVQLLHLEDTAYHAGDWRTNLLTVGIEHEATPTLPPTDALYAASAWLHRHLADELGLDLTAPGVVRAHREIVPTACPGTLDLDRILKEATTTMFTPDDRRKLDRVCELLEAREALVWIDRLQRSLDVERGTLFDPSLPPQDPRIDQRVSAR